MEYFTKELWRQINSKKQEERERAEKEWEENAKKYCDYIQRNKYMKIRKIHKKLAQYDFHDSEIDALCWNSGKQEFVISINGYAENLQIIYSKVKKINLGLNDAVAVPIGLRWGYYELLQESRRLITMDMLFDFENELTITAESIDINEKR